MRYAACMHERFVPCVQSNLFLAVRPRCHLSLLNGYTWRPWTDRCPMLVAVLRLCLLPERPSQVRVCTFVHLRQFPKHTHVIKVSHSIPLDRGWIAATLLLRSYCTMKLHRESSSRTTWLRNREPLAIIRLHKLGCQGRQADFVAQCTL
jgi:hypothetical protein